MVHVAKTATGERLGVTAQDTARRWTELVEHISNRGRVLRRSLAERLSRYSISDSQFSVLWACLKAPGDGLAQTEVAAELGLSPAHVSGQVEQLRDRGLLEGQRGQRDRRRQVWRVTAEGRSLLQRLLTDLELAPDTDAELLQDPAWADVMRLISALAASTNADTNRRIGVGS